MLRVGTKVMLVGNDGFMPPMGAVGYVHGPLDLYGDHEVYFPKHLCPVPPGVTWEIPARWLMPVEDDKDVIGPRMAYA